MLNFSEIFEFSKEKFRKIPILKGFEWVEWFDWFGPSPTEPFNSGRRRHRPHRLDRKPRQAERGVLGPAAVRRLQDQTSQRSGEKRSLIRAREPS